MEAQLLHTGQLSDRLGKTISDTLREPLTTMTQAVNNVTTSQAAAVDNLLKATLPEFKSSMENMLGPQLGDLQTILSSTNEAITIAATEFKNAQQNLKVAGT
jgi:hypothetical protein